MPNLIDLFWTMMGCTATLLGAVHLAIWLRQRAEVMHVAFALLAFTVTAVTVLEWQAMHATTPGEYGMLMRWGQACVLPMVMILVIFVDSLSPGRRWLAASIVVTRAVSVIAAFTTGANASFIEVTGLQQVAIWGGDSVVAPLGPINPWVRTMQLSNLLLLAFVVDALVSLYRLPASVERTRKMRIVGSLLAFIALAALWQAVMTTLGVALPAMVTPAFLGVALVMSYELSSQVLRAAELAQALKITETRLSVSQHGMQLAERAAGLGVWRWDPHDDGVWLSERSARIMGLDEAGTVALQRLSERIDADDLALVRTTARDALRGGAADFSVEFRLRLADGTVRWVTTHGQIERSGQRRGERVHGVMFDLTDRRRAEEQFRLVVDASPTAMLLVDADGRILLANAAAAIVSGYTTAALATQLIETLLPDDQRGPHSIHRTTYFATASRRQMQPRRDVLLKRKDGSQVTVEIALSPVQQHDRTLVIAAINDISERRAKDRELGLQRDALAHLSRVGLLSELSGSLAHELNQPLAAILSNA